MRLTLLVSICVFILAPALILTDAQAQGGCARGVVNCTSNAGIRTCDATLMCTSFSPDTGSRPEVITAKWSLRKTGSNNILNCTPNSLTFSHSR